MSRPKKNSRDSEFDLDEFRSMLERSKKPSGFAKLVNLIPIVRRVIQLDGDGDAEADMRRLRGIIDAMTSDERRDPSGLINQPRLRRIAAGAGVEAAEVNALVKQFHAMAEMMKRMAGLGILERIQFVREFAAVRK